MTLDELLLWSVYFALGVLSFSLVLVFVRLVRGPSLPDRVVALDMISFLAIGFIAMYTLVALQPFFLDAAITLALIAFLATIAFARYVERTGPQRGRREGWERSGAGGGAPRPGARDREPAPGAGRSAAVSDTGGELPDARDWALEAGSLEPVERGRREE